MVCNSLRPPAACFPERLPWNQHDAPRQALPISQRVGGSLKLSVYQESTLQGLCRLWRCRSFNVSYQGPRHRVASPRPTPSTAPSARHMGSAFARSRSWVRSRTRRDLLPFPPSSNGHSTNGNGNGQPRLRDQLCLLIRQYNLDANLVQAYAADFCGTATLSGASRELVESFISIRGHRERKP